MISTSLFPVSVSIFRCSIYIWGYYFLDSTCKWYTVFVFLCLTHFTKHKPPNVKNWLTGKDSDAGKNWRQEEKGMTEAEMVGWHHQLDKTRVWASSGCCWWTGKPRVLQSMGSQRVRHDWATKLILMQSVEQGANEDSGTRGGEGIVSLIMMVVSGENP